MPPSNEPIQPNTTPTNPVDPTGGPLQPMPVNVPPLTPLTPSKPKWPIIAAVVVVLLLAAGVAAYFLMMKPADQTANNNQPVVNGQDETTVTSVTTTNSPNNANGTVSFTHPTSWSATKETDQYGVEHTIIKSPLGNVVDMYTRDSVGGTCEDDSVSYTLIKKIATKNAAYVFSEYQTADASGSQVLGLEPNYNKKSAAHQALTEGKSNIGVCQNLTYYSIAKDIQVTLKNSAGKEAAYNDLKDDADFIAMLQSFNVTDN